MITPTMQKNALVLGLFALMTTGMISGFHQLTAPQIKDSQQQQLANSLATLISSDRYDNDLLHDTIKINDQKLLQLEQTETVYRATKYGQPVAVIFPVIAPDGYSGKIRLLVAIYATGELAGVQVLAHKETPGLGDAIESEKSDWLLSFAGLSLTSLTSAQWHVKKDNGVFDQFTGATITPRAVVKAVHNALLYYQQHQTDLFSRPATTTHESK